MSDRLDLHVLALMGQRAHHQKWAKVVGHSAMDDTARELVKALGIYYDTTGAEAVNWSEFYSWLTVVHMPWKKAAVKQMWHAICQQLTTLEVGEALSQQIIGALTDRHHAAEVRDMVEDIVEGRGRWGYPDVAKAVEKWGETAHQEGAGGKYDHHFVSGPLAQQIQDTATEAGLEWRLEDLNVGYGPLRAGDLVMIAARPGTGKTSLVLYNVTYMTSQLPPGQCCIYFGNEEDGTIIRERAVQAALAAPSKAIQAQPQEAEQAYNNVMGGPDRIMVYSNRHLHIDELVEVCEEYRPGLIVVDQLRKVGGFEKAWNETERFQKLWMEARDLASRLRAPLITVHQANQEADGKLRLKASQLEGCKTEIQGELDLLLMMGCSDPGSPTRMLSIAKTKSRGGPRTDPAYKHGSFPLQFYDETAMFEGSMTR